MFRQDYLMRLIEQLGEALRRLAGLRRKGDYRGAIDGVDREWQLLLDDVPLELVDRVDAATLASMLRWPARMRVAAALLCEQARALAALGDPLHAAARYRRALELTLEARALDPIADDEATILELSRHVPASQLDPRYRGDVTATS